MPGDLKGLLFIDKPSGPTSHDVVKRVRQVSGIRRVGHTGTLDPFASGLLIICIGRATRLAEYLTGLPKTYLATFRLGQETSTYDIEGKIVKESPVQITMAQIEKALDDFRGTFQQVPPMFSAVKHEGQPLYRRARQGERLDRQSRTVTVFSMEKLCWNPPFLDLLINCSSGTYIRSLAHDLGQVLDCGGHVTSLRRTSVGPHLLEEAVSLDDIDKENWLSFLKPAEKAVSHLPVLTLSIRDAALIMQGQNVPKLDDGFDFPLVQAYDSNDRFIGVLESVETFWHGKKIIYEMDR